MAANTSLSRQAGALFSPAHSSAANWRGVWTVGSLATGGRSYANLASRKGRGSAANRLIASELDRQSRRMPHEAPRVAMNSDSRHYSVENINMVLPYTFVTPPLSKWPRRPGDFFRFLWGWLKIRAINTFSISAYKWSTKPAWNLRAVWKRNRGNLVPEAKNLHERMSEALAEGNKTTLQKVCTSALADKLCATIDARPRGQRFGWELVKYNGKPKICDVKVSKLPTEHGLMPMTVHQAVVRIKSRQRLVQYKRNGDVVPGSEKEVDLVEHVVLTSLLPESHEQGEWRVVGTINETTFAAWATEKALVESTENDLAGVSKLRKR